MYDRKILSQLIALTKEIRLIKPEDIKSFEAQFPAGSEPPFISLGGIVITWWYTEKAFKLCDAIASMSIEKYEQLKDGDKEKLSEAIKDAFCSICLDDVFFNGDDVFLRRKECLFDARTTDDVEKFSKKLWSYILSKMKNSIGFWLCVYPLPRLITESYELGSDNISLIKKTDKEAWGNFASEFPETKYWDPSTGLYADGTDTPFSRLKYNTLLVCWSAGTPDGARFKARLRFKRFLSVLYGSFRIIKKHGLTKSAAEPYRVCLQLKSKANPSSIGTIWSEIGELLPYYISDIELEKDTMDLVGKWYQELSVAEVEMQNRLKKATHFINNAMISDDIDSFVHYFISLDALFGKRGDVERSILEGVGKCTSDDVWVHKAEWLYELRSELVHGGIRFEKEWKKFERYLNHFKTFPSYDVMDLAFLCVLKSLLPISP